MRISSLKPPLQTLLLFGCSLDVLSASWESRRSWWWKLPRQNGHRTPDVDLKATTAWHRNERPEATIALEVAELHREHISSPWSFRNSTMRASSRGISSATKRSLSRPARKLSSTLGQNSSSSYSAPKILNFVTLPRTLKRKSGVPNRITGDFLHCRQLENHFFQFPATCPQRIATYGEGI